MVRPLGSGGHTNCGRFFSFVLFCAVAALAACGGSISSAPVSPAHGPATPGSTSVPLSGGAGAQQTITLPTAGGYSGTMLVTLANAASGVAATVSVGTSPPPGAPDPVGTDVPLAFVALTVSSNVTLAGVPTFNFSVPGSAVQSIRRSPQSDGFDLLLDFFDPTDPSAGYQSGATCSLTGDAASCVGGTALFDLLAQLEYVFELTRHAVAPHSIPTPTATPTAGTAGGSTVISVPTPAPIICSPTSDITGVGQTNYIECTAQGYVGAFAVALSDPTIASVAQTSSLTYGFLSVTGLRVGTTTLTLQSKPGGTGTVQITVEP
jgi:hypothetical protein